MARKQFTKRSPVHEEHPAYRNYDRHLLAIDCIIFGFDGEKLKALLVHRGFEPGKGKWSLMGGFVNRDESVDDAAKRVLHGLSGLKDIYMEQLHCFGDPSRDPGGRVISIAYYALIKLDDYGDELMKEHNAGWHELDKLPVLVFDHRKMIKLGRERLQQKAANHPIGFALLPHKFTLPQLQALYEAIYETPLDKRNFTRKINSLGFLQKLEEKEKQNSKRGAFYYVFNKHQYKVLEKTGIKIL
jgi:ADP-ribose pyrophosphatase YjhB (NUDIX family)